MPTEAYVQRQFDDGMAVEKWLETILRELQDVRVVKRRDVAEKPHKHEDIRDIPSSPDLEMFVEDQRQVKVWVTHKKMLKSKWQGGRDSKWLPAMYWRLKTFKSMHEGDYLVYCIFDSVKDFGIAVTQIGDKIAKTKYVKSVPYEVLWMKFDESSYRGIWRDYRLADQDDVRAKVDMSQAKVIYKEGRLLISKLVEVL